MFNFRKRSDVKRRIQRYNEIIKNNPVPSADEIPFWLCEDDVFHHIFDGSPDEEGGNSLFDLVNSVLRNAKMNTVTKLVVKNPNLLKRRRGQKSMILDLLAEDEEGVVYDIEIQKRNRPGFWDRIFAYGDRLRAEQLNTGDDYDSLRRVVVIAFVTFAIRDDENIDFDVYRETSQYDPTVTYDGKTTIFIRIPTKKGQTSSRIEDFGLKVWLKMFGYPKLTTEEDLRGLEKAYPIVRGARKKMLDFFGVFGGQEVRRIELALAEGISEGKIEGKIEGISEGKTEGISEGKALAKRDFVVCALRRRFPNENEKFFSSCVEKLEKKSVDELDSVFDVSLTCSNATEFAEAL